MLRPMAVLLSIAFCLTLCSCTPSVTNSSAAEAEDYKIVTMGDDKLHFGQGEPADESCDSQPECDTTPSDVNTVPSVEEALPDSDSDAEPAPTPDSKVESKPSTPSVKEETVQTSTAQVMTPANQNQTTTVTPSEIIQKESSDELVTDQMLKVVHDRFLELANAERLRLGVTALTVNSHLESIAQTRSAEIITKYSHTRPDGSRFYSSLDTKKYRYKVLAENIGEACHAGYSFSSKDVFVGSDDQINAICTSMFEAFKASEAHYATMINGRYAHTGIGVSYHIDSETDVPLFYFAQIFGNTK